MPVIRNPGSLTTGHGKKAPSTTSRPSLEGAGLVGPGPNIGAIREANPPGLPGQYALETASTHIKAASGAHAASSIQHDGNPDILWSSNVEGALDELAGTVLKRPPMLGEWDPSTSYNGIPDWGSLKVRDDSLSDYGALSFTDGTVQTPGNVYPYLLGEVGPAIDTEFGDLPMGDPWSDWQFNTGTLGLDGAGIGHTHFGGFARLTDLMRTARLYPRPTGVDAETGRPARVPITLSGTIYPADRGVLALLHFTPPRSADPADVKIDFLAQPLISDETAPLDPQGRVVAALLLGNGILDETCQPTDAACGPERVCDGGPGGIFGVGTNAEGNYDPFSFPGRATGQYGLAEIHNGINDDADLLRAPWDDLDGDAVTGTSRGVLDVIPAPGQVRLGTDPNAIPGGTQVNYGIPILGGTNAWYDVAPVDIASGGLGHPMHGDAVIEDSNFFRYRLPVLKDYSQATGLKWTPKGESNTTTQETKRYFTPALPANVTSYPDGVAVTDNLWRTAGVYPAFDEDYWPWQIARYRQTFLMPSIEVDGSLEEVGTYVLIHFKTEADFERCVRDGEFPWAVGDEYPVYGAALVNDPEGLDNVANPWLAATPPVPPNGPAPDYGYAADPYHTIRSRIMLDPVGTALPAVGAESADWSSNSVAGVTENVVWVSGVAYFTPRNPVTGATSFSLTDLSIALGTGFWSTFRTDFDDLSAGVGPALVASQNPVILATAPWGYSYNTAVTLPSSLIVPTNTDPALGLIPTSDYQEQFRLEVPFTHLGSNGGGVFTDINSPTLGDTLSLVLPSAIELEGDNEAPAFSRNALVRVHFRRPLGHTSADLTNLPFTTADGHGHVVPFDVAGTVLLHTTRFDENNLDGLYGNFVQNAVGAPPNLGWSVLHPSIKDFAETFLDEVARYTESAPGALAGHGPYTVDTTAHLDGPGMGGWGGGPIETPVRISLATTPWDECSWLLMEQHLVDLDTSSSLQVAGLPDRNPPISAAATMPFPSAGVLQYPQLDYSTGHFPETVTHITAAQPDYSTAAGVRSYIRCLDASFTHSTTPPPIVVAGQTELTLRIDGITLDDFAYAAPGPGGVAANRIAIMVKVPGLTTWMDAGRLDGAGPGKQDAVLDGAGCQVGGAETYTFTDLVTGHKGCYVKIHVGPAATLFANPADWSAYTAGSPLGECPVLVKVLMDEGAVDYNLEHVATGVGTFEVGVKSGANPDEVRGILGLSVVHPDDVLVSP